MTHVYFHIIDIPYKSSSCCSSILGLPLSKGPVFDISIWMKFIFYETFRWQRCFFPTVGYSSTAVRAVLKQMHCGVEPADSSQVYTSIHWIKYHCIFILSSYITNHSDFQQSSFPVTGDTSLLNDWQSDKTQHWKCLEWFEASLWSFDLHFSKALHPLICHTDWVVLVYLEMKAELFSPSGCTLLTEASRTVSIITDSNSKPCHQQGANYLFISVFSDYNPTIPSSSSVHNIKYCLPMLLFFNTLQL